MSESKDNAYIIAVHGGAGVHRSDPQSVQELKKCLRLACKQSAQKLACQMGALDAVESAIGFLENDPCLNAGLGSNLTIDGTVECDASVMDGATGDFGAVGAVSGVKNPIRAASAVLKHARQPDALGRLPPLLLVSQGAYSLAQRENIECVPPTSLIAPRAHAEWKMWTDRLHSSPDSVDATGLRNIQDTVGAVACDITGGLAAGVSSGGLLLKHAGRVGEAAIFGAGCWAQQNGAITSDLGVACSVSGAGEYIIRATLAKTVGDAVLNAPQDDPHDILHRELTTFYNMCRIRGEPEPSAGILLLVKDTTENQNSIPRLWCAFTTQSMAIGYASSMNTKPKALVLQRPSPPFQNNKASIYITAVPLTD